MRRHTVLHLIHTGGPGGAETVVRDVVARLDPRVWDSVAVVPYEGWLSTALRSGPASVVTLPHGAHFDAPLLFRLATLVRRRRVELIHTHLFGSALYAGLVARVLGLPVVSTLHGSVDLAAAHAWWDLKRQLLRRPAHQWVAVTRALREEMIRELHIPPTRVRTIVNGIDCRRFAPAPARDLRRELGWTHGELVVGALGNLRRPKGYDILLDAAALLRDRCPSCRFVVVGDTAGEPSLHAELLEKRRTLGLDDRVVFTGFRNDAARLLNNFDVYVSSSVREGLPLAILQAMAARLPIVATRSGGPQEFLVHEATALLVPVRDPRALADAVERLGHEPALRERLAGAACSMVRHRYTLGRMVAAYEDLYVAALRSSAGRDATPRLARRFVGAELAARFQESTLTTFTTRGGHTDEP